MPRPMLVLNLAALTPEMVGPDTPALARLSVEGGKRPLVPPLPALTCSSQATLVTGLPPREHGIVANGWYERDYARYFNWNRSARLVAGETIWQAARKRAPSLRCANLFYRFSAHSGCDVIVTERPTYFANGRKGADVYCEPAELHGRLERRLGPFPFLQFWGPAAGLSSSRWILSAAIDVLETDRPDLLLVYAPFLDYEAQRLGPDAPSAREAPKGLDAEVGRLLDAARRASMDVAVVSEYGFVPVQRPIYLNRELRRAGLLSVQRAQNGELLEPGESRAFALCDNQAAHVYVRDARDIAAVRERLAAVTGVAKVLDDQGKREAGLDHPRSGELIALAEKDAWFAYPYWLEESEAPDFAHCIDIFNKPGFDPCELMLRPGLRGKAHLLLRILQMRTGVRAAFDVIDPDASRIRGSRNIDLSDRARGPVLLTSWPQPDGTPLPLADVKAMLLERMFADE